MGLRLKTSQWAHCLSRLDGEIEQMIDLWRSTFKKWERSDIVKLYCSQIWVRDDLLSSTSNRNTDFLGVSIIVIPAVNSCVSYVLESLTHNVEHCLQLYRRWHCDSEILGIEVLHWSRKNIVTRSHPNIMGTQQVIGSGSLITCKIG